MVCNVILRTTGHSDCFESSTRRVQEIITIYCYYYYCHYDLDDESIVCGAAQVQIIMRILFDRITFFTKPRCNLHCVITIIYQVIQNY